MRRYYHLKNPQESTGLVSCIQGVIKQRRFQEPSQEEIARELNLPDLGKDLPERIGKFLSRFNLDLNFRTARHIECPETYLIYSFPKSDIIALFDRRRLNNLPNTEEKSALVAEFREKDSLVLLQEPKNEDYNSVRDLAYSMQGKDLFGFYAIS